LARFAFVVVAVLVLVLSNLRSSFQLNAYSIDSVDNKLGLKEGETLEGKLDQVFEDRLGLKKGATLSEKLDQEFLDKLGLKKGETLSDIINQLLEDKLQIRDGASVNTTIAAAAATTTTEATTSGNEELMTQAVKAVDCRTLPPAKHDPNKGMEEDPKKLVNLARDDKGNVVPTPEFWIALHKRWFDTIRWTSIMDKGIYYEVGITRIFQEILDPSKQPKGIVIDVGMNIGWFTLLSRALGHEVIAFDPNPIMHHRMCSSLALNHWWDRNHSSSSSSGVTTFQCGVGDKPGVLEFAVGRNPGGGSLDPNQTKQILEKFKNQFQVPVTTLDQIASERGWLDDTAPPIIHLLKIDVENFEPFVIKGASKLIRSGAIKNILYESAFKRQKIKEDIVTIAEELYASGYKIHAVTDTGGTVRKGNQIMVEPANQHLQNKTFAGSKLFNFLAKKDTNLWWKKRD